MHPHRLSSQRRSNRPGVRVVGLYIGRGRKRIFLSSALPVVFRTVARLPFRLPDAVANSAEYSVRVRVYFINVRFDHGGE